MKNYFTKILLILALSFGLSKIAAGQRFNDLILEQIRTMPQGGGYSASSFATSRLQSSVALESGRLSITPDSALPSYCSGATYLVFLKTIEALRDHGALMLDQGTVESLLVRGQRDGQGIWGRWNANGPGTARLFHEMELGKNFDDFAQARRGDFMKIFWSTEVGRTERGHSVIYLGMEKKDGSDYVRFWSSNIPTGYGEKSVPRTKIVHAIFSRLDSPENLTRAPRPLLVDKYLASLLSTRSSYEEAKAKCGM